MDWRARDRRYRRQRPALAHAEDAPHESHAYPMARRATQTVTWEDLAATAETGDIALFSGQSLISEAIKLAEMGSHWSHIGMFVRESTGQLRIWESTNADGQVDLISGKAKGGVRLVDAETAVRSYLASAEGAMVVARRLYIDQAVLGKPGLVDPVARLPKLRAFMHHVSSLPYERNPLDLVRAAEIARWIQLVYAWRSNNSYFCSELVACSYIQLGLLPDDSESDRHPGLYTPKDWSQEAQNLPFLYDKNTDESMVALGPHLQIVFPDAGPDPMHTPPRRMPNPRRPRLRVDLDTLQS